MNPERAPLLGPASPEQPPSISVLAVLKAIRVEALTVCYSVLSHLFWTQYIAILISGITTPAIGAFHLHCHPRVLPCTNCTRGTHSGRRLCLAGRHDDDDEKYDDGEDKLLMRTLNHQYPIFCQKTYFVPTCCFLLYNIGDFIGR